MCRQQRIFRRLLLPADVTKITDPPDSLLYAGFDTQYEYGGFLHFPC